LGRAAYWISRQFDPFIYYAEIHSRQIKLLPDNRLRRIWGNNAKWKSGLNPAETQHEGFLSSRYHLMQYNASQFVLMRHKTSP
jgi:hypothetical protein